jgi:fructokinase
MSEFDAIAVGETLMDVVVSSHGTVERPGGSPMNVAIGLARLGLHTGLLTSIGTDQRGERLRSHIERDDVVLLDGSVNDGPSSTSAATLDDSGAASYEFAINWDIGRDVSLPPATAIHAGSIGSYLEPGASEVAAILERHRGTAVTSYDPNVRPSLIPGTKVERVRARIEECAALSAIVKLSDEDAEWLYPGATTAEVLTRFVRAGTVLAIMTRGASGATLATTRFTVELPSAPVVVVDTIGAGDSYMAAVLSQLIVLDSDTRGRLIGGDESVFDEALLRQIGGFAARCAGITVSRAGANPPRRVDLLAQQL